MVNVVDHFMIEWSWTNESFSICVGTDCENYETADKMIRRTSYAGEASSRTALQSGNIFISDSGLPFSFDFIPFLSNLSLGVRTNRSLAFRIDFMDLFSYNVLFVYN